MSAHPLVLVRTTIIRLFALCALLISELTVAATVVSNLSAAQRAGTKLVDIQYDLATTGFATVAVTQRDAPATSRLDPKQTVIFH
jgi:hypothetical protein